MDSNVSADTKATVMLCGVLENDRSEKPLTPTEYNKLAHWLVSKDLRPANLLNTNSGTDTGSDTDTDTSAGALTNASFTDMSLASGIEKQRLKNLLGRGVQLGFALEKWQRHGIWIISRSDDDYPERLRKRLKNTAPPLLFGAGDRSLLKRGGLAIVGSRRVDEAGGLFARDVATLCAKNSMMVISGGAKGVDQIAMSAALAAGGLSVGILADSLLKKSVEQSARQFIAEGRLLLLSSVNPNARFNVGSAMSRNRLIYVMSDYGLVVSADYNKGGTWAGAKEQLKPGNPFTVFVRTEGTIPAISIPEGNTPNPEYTIPAISIPEGNTKLLELGARPWPSGINEDNLKTKLQESAAENAIAASEPDQSQAQPQLPLDLPAP